jgi:DNA-binding winged helix-turn-helix (wHTH) protein
MQAAFALGEWLVEPSLNRIGTSGRRLRLRQQVMEILVYLASLDGQVATLESIHDNLWRGKVVSSSAIYNCIAELRRALASSGSGVKYIQTLPKRGYRLAVRAAVRPRLADIGQEPSSIAIYPLTHHSGDPATSDLCEGIDDELLFRLSCVDDLQVYSARGTMNVLRDSDARPPGFEAQTVLTGRLQRQSRVVRTTFRLQQASSGRLIWSGRFDEFAADLFRLQTAVAQRVCEAIAPRLLAGQADQAECRESGAIPRREAHAPNGVAVI